VGWGLLSPLARAAMVVAVLAPVSVAMGLPFPLGLGAQPEPALLPWSWGLNGAFSVVATPLANLVLRNNGLHAVLAVAIAMYVLAACSFPSTRSDLVWLKFSKTSAAADS
jgi:hypothetical protein